MAVIAACAVSVTAAPARAEAPTSEAEAPSKLPPVLASVIAVAGAGFAVYARGRAHDAAAPLPYAASQAVYDDEAKRVRRWNAGLVVGASVGGAAAVAAGLLWYRALRAPAPVALEVDGDGARVSLRGSF